MEYNCTYRESFEQLQVFEWARACEKYEPKLKWLYSSQAGVKLLNSRAGARAKRQGNKRGIADIFLPVVKRNANGEVMFSGLYIEMKRPKTYKSPAGRLSDEQKEFLDFVNKQGYLGLVCYSGKEAIDEIKTYLDLAYLS